MVELFQTYTGQFIEGFKYTVMASLIALFFSLLIGTLMAIFQLSDNRLIKGIAKAYVEFFRNIPLLIIVMFFMSLCQCIGFRRLSSRNDRLNDLYIGIYR